MLSRVRLLGCVALGLGCQAADPPPPPTPAPLTLPGAHLSTGPATQTDPGLLDCGKGSRPSAVGTATATDGTTWTVPADTAFKTAPKATDLYNECGGVTRAGISELDLSSVPLLDAGGTEEFVAYVFADNYFELNVNGRLIAVDAVPFTPFNSSVVRFKADRPVTLAFKLVDWEENLGLGSESGRGKAYHPGDAGLVAHIQDAQGKTVLLTDGTWKAQTFYTAPLRDPSCVTVEGAARLSTACQVDGAADGSHDSAIFWDVPKRWADPDFDDSGWPRAVVFSNETVGVKNKPAYTNFAGLFDTPGADAQFIWSSNLVLDNLVLVRGVIGE